MLKYELEPSDRANMYRIRALRDFGNVKCGDLGGYVANDRNLSQLGDCWMFDNSSMQCNARMVDNSAMFGNARMFDNARMADNTRMFGNASMRGNSSMADNARMFDNSSLQGDARMFDNSSMFDNASMRGNATLANSSVLLWSIHKSPESVNTSDGYTMTLDEVNGKISAGCRYFTFEDAIDHWTVTRGNTLLGKTRLLQVEYLQKIYAMLIQHNNSNF